MIQSKLEIIKKIWDEELNREQKNRLLSNATIACGASCYFLINIDQLEEEIYDGAKEVFLEDCLRFNLVNLEKTPRLNSIAQYLHKKNDIKPSPDELIVKEKADKLKTIWLREFTSADKDRLLKAIKEVSRTSLYHDATIDELEDEEEGQWRLDMMLCDVIRHDLTIDVAREREKLKALEKKNISRTKIDKETLSKFKQLWLTKFGDGEKCAIISAIERSTRLSIGNDNFHYLTLNDVVASDEMMLGAVLKDAIRLGIHEEYMG